MHEISRDHDSIWDSILHTTRFGTQSCTRLHYAGYHYDSTSIEFIVDTEAAYSVSNIINVKLAVAWQRNEYLRAFSHFSPSTIAATSRIRNDEIMLKQSRSSNTVGIPGSEGAAMLWPSPRLSAPVENLGSIHVAT